MPNGVSYPTNPADTAATHPAPHSRSTSYAPAVLTISSPRLPWRTISWTAAPGPRCRVFPPSAIRAPSGTVAIASANVARLSLIDLLRPSSPYPESYGPADYHDPLRT